MLLYYFGISEITDMTGKQLLARSRREQIDRFLKDEDKKRCLTAGLLLRMAFGQKAEILETNSYGKPYLRKGPFFNISHSGEYVVLGVSENEIGADIEQIKPFDIRVAKRCFTDAELEWLSAQRADEAFYRLWTAKESVMKASGLGFGMPPESFCVLPMTDGRHRIYGTDWYLSWHTLPGHAICVACTTEEDVHMLPVRYEQLLR